MIWDAIWLALLWFTLTGLRIWIREVWTFDLIKGNPILEEVEFHTHAPLVVPIVVCWVLWLYRLGAYRVLAGLEMRRLIGASVLALCTLLAFLFSVQATDILSRSLYFGFAFVSGPVLWMERRLLMWLQKTGLMYQNRISESSYWLAIPKNRWPIDNYSKPTHSRASSS